MCSFRRPGGSGTEQASSDAGWDGGTRTHYIGVKVRCVTITLHPRIHFTKKAGAAGLFAQWGGIWGSNPRHPEPQSGALPTELIPPSMNYSLFSRIQNQSEDFDFVKDEQRSERAFEPARKRDDAKLARTCGTPRGIRTPDLLLRRQLLYPAELLAHKRLTKAQRAPVQAGAGDGNRTHVSSLEGWCSTIELHPHGLFSPKIIP